MMCTHGGPNNYSAAAATPPCAFDQPAGSFMKVSTSASILGSNLPLAFATASTSHQVVSACSVTPISARHLLAFRIGCRRRKSRSSVRRRRRASRIASTKFTLLRPSVISLQTSSTRWPGSTGLDLHCGQSPWLSLRTYCIGRFMRPSATQAAKGCRRSRRPPYVVSILARADARCDAGDREGHHSRAHFGKRDQPARVVTERARPAEVKMNGLSVMKRTAPTSRYIFAVSSGDGLCPGTHLLASWCNHS